MGQFGKAVALAFSYISNQANTVLHNEKLINQLRTFSPITTVEGFVDWEFDNGMGLMIGHNFNNELKKLKPSRGTRAQATR